MTDKNRIAKIVYGMALGDAWGHHLEFKRFSEISKIDTPYPLPKAFITDDTQMSLYAIRGVHKAEKYLKSLSPQNPDLSNKVRVIIANEFLQWLHDPENNRAPGNACLTALFKLEERKKEISGLFDRRKLTGIEGTQSESKGCGANMRNPWFGALPYDHDVLDELSFIQAEITHSHPLAYAAASLTASLVKDLIDGVIKPVKGEPILFDHLIKTTTEKVNRQWTRERASKGFEMALDYFHSVESYYKQAVKNDDGKSDLCSYIDSQGWVAEEALLVAVLANELHSDNLLKTLHRAVRTNGDSDSIAAIAGSISGAYTDNEIPEEYVKALEQRYREELAETVNVIAAIC
jgi:ADP-ribosylglycohydrolase